MVTSNRYGTSVSQMTMDMFHSCSCRKYFPVLSSSMTYHRVCNWSNTTGATNGAGTAYPSGAPEFTHGLRVTRSLVLCVMLCRSLFVLLSFFFLPMCCLSFFDRYTDSDYPFGIFKLFFVIYPCVRIFNIEKQMSLF